MRSLILALALTASLNTYAQEEALITLNAEQQAAFGIQTSSVQPVTRALSKPYPARVAVPNDQLRVVSAPLDGVVEAMLVAEGAQVKTDQVLARLHSPGLLELQASYLEARTRRMLSGESLARDRALHADGIIARRRLLETEASHREFVNAEARDRQALLLAGMSETAIKQLARSQKLSSLVEVRAPLDGVILEQIATGGQRLMTSDPLYRIGHLQPLWIEVHVPLESLGNLQPGDEILVTDAGLPAKIITVGRMIHGSDQGVLIRAELHEGVDQLRPGQFVEARLALAAEQHALRVPARAVVRQAGQDYVFAQRADGYAIIAVTVLAHEGKDVVLEGALNDADAVVINGTAALKASWPGGME
jgi:RND family efflux transporter MFP subunit